MGAWRRSRDCAAAVALRARTRTAKSRSLRVREFSIGSMSVTVEVHGNVTKRSTGRAGGHSGYFCSGADAAP